MLPFPPRRSPIPITLISPRIPLRCEDCGGICLPAYWRYLGTAKAVPSCTTCARRRSDAQAARVLKRQLGIMEG